MHAICKKKKKELREEKGDWVWKRKSPCISDFEVVVL
jgi:hypothetical protein